MYPKKNNACKVFPEKITFIRKKRGRIFMKTKKIVNEIEFDPTSVKYFIEMEEKEEWSEQDIDAFVSSDGIQFLINQEEESGPNSDPNVIKEYLVQVKQGIPGEHGGWTAALKNKTRIQKRLENILNRWDYLMVRPISSVSEYMSKENSIHGTVYLLPGGSKKAYASAEGIGINLVYPVKDAEWLKLVSMQCCSFWMLNRMGESLSPAECKTPLGCVEALLSITHRLGMELYMGLKASAAEDEFFQNMQLETEKEQYSEAFKSASNGECFDTQVYSGYDSPAALIGATMARDIEENISPLKEGKEALAFTVTRGGYFIFFRLYKGCRTYSSLLSDAVWNIFSAAAEKKGLGSTREPVYLP